MVIDLNISVQTYICRLVDLLPYRNAAEKMFDPTNSVLPPPRKVHLLLTADHSIPVQRLKVTIIGLLVLNDGKITAQPL